jgi:hypothetical protein
MLMKCLNFNRAGRSRVIFYHSRDIGIGCFRSCNHYKDDGRGCVQYHGKEGYPVCVDELVKVVVCGSGS